MHGALVLVIASDLFGLGRLLQLGVAASTDFFSTNRLDLVGATDGGKDLALVRLLTMHSLP